MALVTGSAGFVGRHMADELERRGYTVIRVDLVEDHRAAGLRWPMDVRTWFATEGVYCEVDLVVHCAAVVGGRTMIDGAPLQLAAEDLSIDAELFRWLLGRKTCPKVVYYSSSAAYPVELQDPTFRVPGAVMALRESDIDLDLPGEHYSYLPDATYGWVKLTGERLAAEAQKMGLPVYVFRPFSGYGSDQHLDYPFPSFVDRARRQVVEFEVWGPGTQVRDFVHIDDVVGATMARLDGDDLSPVNICTGIGTSFLELAQLVMTEAGFQAPIVTHPDKPVGVLHRVGDPALMRQFYEPTVTLTEGIRRALEAN